MKPQFVALTVTEIAATAELISRRFAGFDGGVAAPGTKAFGVVEADADAGNPAPVNVLGVILVEAGGAITAGSEVEVGAQGKAVAKASGVVNGFSLDAATADGDLIRIVRGI